MDEFLKVLPALLSILSTVIIGLVGWGFRGTLTEFRTGIKKNAEEIEKVDKRHTGKVEKLESNFNNLKADLPLIYVTRTEYIQTMNKVEDRIKSMDNKLDRVLDRLMTRGGPSDG